jgi:hypothetical protein
MMLRGGSQSRLNSHERSQRFFLLFVPTYRFPHVITVMWALMLNAEKTVESELHNACTHHQTQPLLLVPLALRAEHTSKPITGNISKVSIVGWLAS